jgi:hypothetical protein
MTAKTSTFAGQLKHFAQSVDIVDSTTFDQVRDLVRRYVEQGLRGQYFELVREELTGDGHGLRQSWLRTFWSSEEKRHHWSIRDQDGNYTNPVTDAFDNDRPLWLVSSDRNPLDQPENYRDLWSDASKLTRYWPSSNQPIRTVIIVPLAVRRRILGVFCIESSQYTEVTDVAKLELLRLAEALAILYSLWDINRAQAVSTHHAINDLWDFLNRAKFPKLAKPHMFLAFPSRGDETVHLLLEDVLSEFQDQLEWTNWSKMHDSGNISEQIGRDILESRFGLCYLSEPVHEAESAESEAAGQNDATPRRYNDNPNVVFEAGMLHARITAATEENVGEPVGWIPLREKNSPSPPFDFAAERILYVPRSNTGQLNEGLLRQVLRERISALLSQD